MVPVQRAAVSALRTIRPGHQRAANAEPPNQALQTTPMTRSVYEKTLEFVDPQRGV